MRKTIAPAPLMIALALLMPACASNKPAPEAAAPEADEAPAANDNAADDSPIGVPACDRYLAKFIVCSADMPQEAREASWSGLDHLRSTWRSMAKSDPAALEQSCLSALTAAGEAMGPICPSVVWE